MKHASLSELHAVRRSVNVKHGAERAMRKAMHQGVDPRNSFDTAARLYTGPGFPPVIVVNGRKVFAK